MLCLQEKASKLVAVINFFRQEYLGAVSGRRHEALSALAAELGRGAYALAADLGDRAGVAALAADAEAVGLSLEQRLSRLERLSGSQKLVEIFLQIKRVQQEMDALRGELEILSHNMEGVKRRQKDLYVDLDQRIQVIELAAKMSVLSVESVSASTEVSKPAIASIGAGQMPSATVKPVSEASLSYVQQQTQYEEAFNFLKKGLYEQSIEKFQAFLQVAPTGGYSDNAQYWLGEARYVLEDYQAAIIEFTKVIENFPNSPKIPDARLKIGFSYQALQADDQAIEVLQGVIDHYPDTTAARLANRRMQQMRVQ